jgi:hypothetical protein
MAHVQKDPLAELLELQAGVISRRQVLEAELGEHGIRRKVRRREWAVVHPGVYVDHTGPLTFLQRCWAAVLFAWPAALCDRTALRLEDGPGRHGRSDDDPIHVAVPLSRRVRPPPGVREHRVADLSRKVRWNASPPRVRIEHVVIDLAAAASSELDTIGELADAVRSRRTTPDRLLESLHGRAKIARRAFLEAVIRDLRDGTCSVLEHAFLTRVERAHGLPVGERQVLASSRGTIYRDVLYEAFRTVVELDGHTHHSSLRDRDRDLDRDLDAALDDLLTVRLGWGQVLTRGCQTAAKLGVLLRSRGWDGVPVPCALCEPGRAEDGGHSQSPSDREFPPSSGGRPAA